MKKFGEVFYTIYFIASLIVGSTVICWKAFDGLFYLIGLGVDYWEGRKLMEDTKKEAE